jgi:drug/metabolite transporter (DMT)-like permease
MSGSSNRVRGMVWATLATVCWGSAIVMSKDALQVLSPDTLLVVQLLASTVFVWTVLLCRRTPRLPWRTSVKIGALGWLEPGLAYFFSLAGLASTRAGIASLLQATEAFMVMVLASVLLRQRLKPIAVLLGVMALIGVVLATGIGLGGGADQPSIGGPLLVLLGTFCAALYVTLSSRLVGDHEPLYMVGMQQLFALPLALALAFREPFALAPLAKGPLALIIASGILQYSLAFWFYLLAMRHLSARTAGMFLSLIPIIALVGAYVFLGEALRVGQWAGVAIVLAAILLFTLTADGEHGGHG